MKCDSGTCMSSSGTGKQSVHPVFSNMLFLLSTMEEEFFLLCLTATTAGMHFGYNV